MGLDARAVPAARAGGLDAPMLLGRQVPARFGCLPSHFREIPHEVRQRSGKGGLSRVWPIRMISPVRRDLECSSVRWRVGRPNGDEAQARVDARCRDGRGGDHRDLTALSMKGLAP